MCSKPSTPTYEPATVQQVVAPTYADAKTTKTTANIRNKKAALAGRNIKNSSRGLSDEASTEKKNLLGG